MWFILKTSLFLGSSFRWHTFRWMCQIKFVWWQGRNFFFFFIPFVIRLRNDFYSNLKNEKLKYQKLRTSFSFRFNIYWFFLLLIFAVESLIYWRDVKKSGAVFGSGLVILLAISFFSVISVIAYLSLLVLAGTVAFRVYKTVLQAVQKTNDGHPFKWVASIAFFSCVA